MYVLFWMNVPFTREFLFSENMFVFKIAHHNILSPLSQLIKKYPDEDSINGRIFRIIGNMCHHRDRWENIIIDRKPGLVSHIVNIINKVSEEPDKEIFSEATVSMAIRALR